MARSYFEDFLGDFTHSCITFLFRSHYSIVLQNQILNADADNKIIT